MYYLNGSPLRLDKAFVDADGNQYPANWLRTSTPEQRDALGIVWIAKEQPSYDQKFYWGPENPKALEDQPQLDENGDPVPDGVPSPGLKTLWIGKQKTTAGTLLAPSDWMIIRSVDSPGVSVPAEVTDYRTAVRAACDAREAQINACTTTEELEQLIKQPPTITVEVDGEIEMQDNPDALTPWPVA